ncbi:hypothetical protein [Phenylobacterium sp.]|nr:hypothetical protein [Phenylobacterium sp.]MBA4795725.1 hypothetical protein [Phenylobacterium sp.]MBC7167507.1 hypothetical protein [Phenylobacterium sp.]
MADGDGMAKSTGIVILIVGFLAALGVVAAAVLGREAETPDRPSGVEFDLPRAPGVPDAPPLPDIPTAPSPDPT